MNTKTPAQTPEGRLIEDATKASGLSVRSLAAKAGISDTRWRHIVKGWQSTPGGGNAAVRAPAPTLARMAFVLNLTPDQLTDVGRTDAVQELERLQREGTSGTSMAVPQAALLLTEGADEIELIYASKTMTAQEKLAAIRIVLQLRAQVEQESADGEAGLGS